MGKKTPPPQPPNLQPITDAQLQIAKESNELAREQLGLSKEQFAWMQENSREELKLAREQADKLFGFQEKAFASDEEAKAFARQVGQTQIDAMNLQMGYAKEDRERYKNIFLPMQDRFIAEAEAFDTPERREAEAAKVMGDVQRQSEAARNNADSRLRSMGIDPSQVRSSSMMNQLAVAGGANQALAGNNARTFVEERGRQLRADALNIGMGLPSQSAMGFQGAGAAGQGALGAGAAGQQAQLAAIQGGAGVAGTAMGFRSQALNNVAQLTGSPMQWAQMGSSNMGQAANTYGMAANTMNSGFQNQMQSWKAGQEQAQQKFNNIMSVASMAGGMMMAEGGVVRRAEGGSAAPAAPDPGVWGEIKDRWAKKRAAEDPYTRQGMGSGEGGALSMMDRMDNGAAAAQAYAPTNLYSELPEYRAQAIPLNAGGQQPQFAEGGRARFKGALPTRQSRDNIPAWLTEGEYIVPRDVVAAKGIEFFDRLTKKYHRENS